MEREYEDEEWSRAVDNAIILMSLVVCRSLLHRWKGSSKVKKRITMRMDRLIAEYKDPNV